MNRRWSLFAAAGVLFAASLTVSASQEPEKKGGWTLPANAADEKNPFAGDANAITAGKTLFAKHCERCHGPGGKGDGKDADPDAAPDMDLTVARRGPRNPDGVVFYKMWNGRAKPKMPAVKDDLTKEQAWQIVSFVQTLRQK